MKDAKKHDVINEEPLFCPEQEEEQQPNDDNVHEVVSVDPSPIVVDSEDQENQPGSFKIVNGQVVVKDPSMLATLQELDKIYMESHNAQQESSSSDEEEITENDEDARQALHKMLEEFGGGF